MEKQYFSSPSSERRHPIYSNIGAQVWVTAQALTALLASPLDLKEDRERVTKAFDYIEKNRNDEFGGWPLFEDPPVPLVRSIPSSWSTNMVR
jgi:hypothetical protein